MKLTMIGTGYVGLVTGTCFADSGNQVTCVDIVASKIEQLQRGEIPIYEPQLADLVRKNADAGRLHFTTDLGSAVASADIVYLAVGTPSSDDGSADLTYFRSAVQSIAPHLAVDAIVVIKSTVPVGTNQETYETLKELTGRDCHVASNPEFLKEGAAVDDFTNPDRVVVGTRSTFEKDRLRELYEPFLLGDRPFLHMSPQSAELTKYVANAMLSTKISFINEMANICERMEGDIDDVREGIGHDQRIGFAFLAPGAGYGGSCFPKDVRALANIAKAKGITPLMMDAVDKVNQLQKHVLIKKLEAYFGDQLKSRKIAMWGLSFKPGTDDIREAPALAMIDRLLEIGASIVVHDPVAMKNVRRQYETQITYANSPMEALDAADALAIHTEWQQYRSPDFDEMKRRMAALLSLMAATCFSWMM